LVKRLCLISHKLLEKEPFNGKLIFRIIPIIVTIPVFLIILEASYFSWFFSGNKELREADIIVVFDGGYNRAETAFNLVDQSHVTNLLISPATEKK
jgi:hypothetical protein